LALTSIMPISNQLLVRSTIALLAVALLSLLGIVGATIWLSERTQTYFNEVVEARDARTATVDLRNALQIAETSQRGFLLTGDESYLASYQPVHDAIPTHLSRVEAILKPYPEADAPMAKLRADMIEKLAEMDQTIALRRDGRTEDALALVNTDRGKQLMDDANAFFTGLIAAADERLTTGVADQRWSAGALRWVTIVGGLIIIVVVAGAALMVVRYTIELGEARAEVVALNAGLEQRVSERTADLAQANDEIQRFAYIVTHDLRAPLVNIMGFTAELETSVRSVQALVEKADVGDDPELIEARKAATEELPEAIAFIRSSTLKMDKLINAILKLSREGRRVLKAERVDLREVLTAATGALQHQLVEAEGEVALSLDVPAISTDRLSLEQVMGNLLDNAVKYRAKERPLRIAVTAALAPGNRVIIDIADNGRGIAEQDRERIFELFRRSGVQDQAGEGIGLAYVRTVVRNLGGDITVSSELGKGTSFRITLPRVLQVARSASA
jgi:signal transduction histidine kinase